MSEAQSKLLQNIYQKIFFKKSQFEQFIGEYSYNLLLEQSFEFELLVDTFDKIENNRKTKALHLEEAKRNLLDYLNLRRRRITRFNDKQILDHITINYENHLTILKCEWDDLKKFIDYTLRKVYDIKAIVSIERSIERVRHSMWEAGQNLRNLRELHPTSIRKFIVKQLRKASQRIELNNTAYQLAMTSSVHFIGPIEQMPDRSEKEDHSDDEAHEQSCHDISTQEQISRIIFKIIECEKTQELLNKAIQSYENSYQKKLEQVKQNAVTDDLLANTSSASIPALPDSLQLEDDCELKNLIINREKINSVIKSKALELTYLKEIKNIEDLATNASPSEAKLASQRIQNLKEKITSILENTSDTTSVDGEQCGLRFNPDMDRNWKEPSEADEKVNEDLNADKSCQVSLQSISLSEASHDTFAEQLAAQRIGNLHYVKEVLGNPLRLGLAAVILHRPSDPINYLGNFLVQYHHSLLSVEKRNHDLLQAQEAKRLRDIEESRFKNRCDGKM